MYSFPHKNAAKRGLSRASGSFSSTQASELARKKCGTQIACTQFPARCSGMGPVRGQWVDINSSKMNLELPVLLPFLLTGWSTRPEKWPGHTTLAAEDGL